MERLFKQYNYPSLKRFSEILKENGIKVSQKEIKEFLKNQAINQLHKPVQKVKKNLKHITASSPNETWQIDLLDYQKYGRQNKGYKYIFICVDVFTRKAKAEPIKTKAATNTAAAFQKIIADAEPKAIYSDDGSEWKAEFKHLLESKKIVHVVNDYGDHNSLGIIDRFSRTIKTEIAKFMTANNTKKWVDDLPRLIDLYNNTPHSGIENIKPINAARKENAIKIGTLNFDKTGHNSEVDKKSNTINIGDYVRVQRLKGTFEKGYTITYTKKIFQVVKTTALKAELDSGDSYKKNKLMKVGSPEGIGVQRTDYTPPKPPQVAPAAKVEPLRYVRKSTIDFFSKYNK